MYKTLNNPDTIGNEDENDYFASSFPTKEKNEQV